MFKIDLIYNEQHDDHGFEPVGPLFFTVAHKSKMLRGSTGATD